MRLLKNYKTLLLIVISSCLYFFFGFFLERNQFYPLAFSYLFLFFAFFLLLQWNKNNFALLAGIALLFRFILLFTTPNLSQDFYRFIWDGRMLLEGLNPYLSLPETFIQQQLFPVHEAQKLYEGMGELNGSHYTNYPPLNQLCFLIAALFASKSIFGAVIILRLIIILADIGILYFGKKLLEKLGLPIQHIFWYILNPFIIIELTGNLHFESLMLFFLIWSFYQLQQKKWFFAAVLLACSISVKLIPLLFLPLFFQWFTPQKGTLKKPSWLFLFEGIKKLTVFYALVISTIILLFLPFYADTLVSNYLNSVGLWFNNFEFNASFYYVFRALGYWISGYNQIAIIGQIIPVLTVLFLIFITFFKENKTLKQLITACLFGLSFYYFTTTTLHPWYLATLILLAVFTKYRFPMVWSLVIVLSYSAYQNETYQENLGFIFLEYIIVYGFLIWELLPKRKQSIPLI